MYIRTIVTKWKIARNLLTGACFSKVPKLFGRFSGDIILFVSSKRRCSMSRNFAVILIFIPFTTYEKISFTEWGGPKSLRDFRETGPWSPSQPSFPFFGMSQNAPPKGTCVPLEGALRDTPKDGCEGFVARSDIEVNVKGEGTLRDV